MRSIYILICTPCRAAWLPLLPVDDCSHSFGAASNNVAANSAGLLLAASSMHQELAPALAPFTILRRQQFGSLHHADQTVLSNFKFSFYSSLALQANKRYLTTSRSFEQTNRFGVHVSVLA